MDGLVFRLITTLLVLMHVGKGQNQEADSSQTIRAMLGDGVVLPCHLKLPEDPSQITVEWGRPDLRPRFVHVWHNQKEYLTDQNRAYRGRTSLFHDKLNKGDASLSISNVTHSDNGRYRCYNPKEKTEYFVTLLVGSVSPPGISLAGLDKSVGGVMLDCSSAGWYPEPELFWLDGEGNIMSAGPPETIRGPDGVYRVSSRVTVEKRHNDNKKVTCRVHQKDINQTRETHLSLPDDFFMFQSTCSVSIAFSVILAFLCVSGVVFLIWREKQKQNIKEKRGDGDDEEQQKLLKDGKLKEELKYRDEEQRNVDQTIQTLTKMSAELMKQKKQLSDQRTEAERLTEETETKLKEVDDEVIKEKGNKTEKKALGYLKLKEIIMRSNENLDKTKHNHQMVEMMTDQLMKRTSDEVKKLRERKQEIENRVGELKKQLDVNVK